MLAQVDDCSRAHDILYWLLGEVLRAMAADGGDDRRSGVSLWLYVSVSCDSPSRVGAAAFPAVVLPAVSSDALCFHMFCPGGR